MELEPGGRGRMWISLGVLGTLAALAGLTMEADRYRTLVLLLLGMFAVRIVLAGLRRG